MHTMQMKIDDKEVYVHHNGDWSGDAIIDYYGDDHKRRKVAVPGEMLIALSKAAAIEYVKDKVIAHLDMM